MAVAAVGEGSSGCPASSLPEAPKLRAFFYCELAKLRACLNCERKFLRFCFLVFMTVYLGGQNGDSIFGYSKGVYSTGGGRIGIL